MSLSMHLPSPSLTWVPCVEAAVLAAQVVAPAVPVVHLVPAALEAPVDLTVLQLITQMIQAKNPVMDQKEVTAARAMERVPTAINQAVKIRAQEAQKTVM